MSTLSTFPVPANRWDGYIYTNIILPPKHEHSVGLNNEEKKGVIHSDDRTKKRMSISHKFSLTWNKLGIKLYQNCISNKNNL